ncbi:sugar ABC transporter substrate-binding protein, partial [Rhizobium johnstonii]
GVASFVMPAMAQDKGLVGIAIPTKSSALWIDDGNNIVKQLEAAGYKTDLHYADDDIPNHFRWITSISTVIISAMTTFYVQ